jgi:hypothetical protein
MFQYACGRALALRNKDTLKLDITEWTLEREKLRSYLLPHFMIVENIATDKEVARLKYPFGIFLGKILGKIRFMAGVTNVSFKPSILTKKGDVYLDGYWQSEKYFADAAEQIRSDFTLKNPLGNTAAHILDAIKKNKTAISLNIRRGDNAHNPSSMRTFGCPGIEYYMTALKIMIEKMKAQGDDIGNIHIYVFSDDIVWAEEHLNTGFPMTFVSGPNIDTCEEITLMSACTHNIISNSTFGWWGAWLNRNTEKIVVAPKQWVLIGLENYKDTIPPGWIRV